ncbi:ankyrin repeat domain-containing protein 53 [Eublepharis macularius]|uniref:Ankyrin repeat domain-containing protein 53 n=1 Tax=Eublepharis macularius TaxID=481883 RepID=A0AA97K031_EUBMA|nr:ankyrin repeat domain-containing protein 53 [Eublepharis macularius]
MQKGFSALHTAALFGRLDCIQMLVEKFGVSVDSESLTGWRPVHLVMNKESGNRALECLKYLISKSADVNIKNQNGVTPLHKAASEGRTSCVKILIEAGADVHAKDAEGQEPVDLCRMWGHRHCCRYLSSAMWKIDKKTFAQGICRLNLIKKECQAKEEEFLRIQQMKVNVFNNIKFSEWLAKKHLPPPSARILSFLEKRPQSVILRKQWGKQDSISISTSGPEEIYLLDDLKKDRHQRPWNISSNPASVPVTCIFRPTTVRMGTNPEPSEDHDFTSFLFLVKNRCGEPRVYISNFGKVSPMPDLPYETIQRSLYPHTRPTRLKVPQGLKPWHIFDVQRKYPPSPEHRWTDQMALSLRQTLDPTFVATLKAHLETYSDAGALSPKLDSYCGSSQESSSPSLNSSHLD